MKRTLLAIATLAALPASAGIITYVENPTNNCPTARCDALGYPVPLPVESQTPVDGFRSYAALQARLADLAALSPSIERQVVGSTVYARDIYAYVLGDADQVTAEGFPEPATLQIGTIHAREWAAPEVVAGIAERLAANEGDNGLYRYLLDNVTMTLVPTLNTDGFLQTQRYPDKALETEFTGPQQDSANSDPPEWPRDGRMRRKNLRCDAPACSGGRVDEALDVGGDGMYGTDNNRNNPPFFDSGNENSDDPRSLIYHGPQAGEERENQALYAAAALGPANRLRLYIDTHSYSRVFYSSDTGNARRDRMARTLHGVMNGPTGNRYAHGPSAPGYGIGATDEYFSYTYQIPGYTLEIEPQSDGDFGFGASHGGFVLPESEIARVRRQLGDAAVAGYYRMAGPPSIGAAQIRRKDDGTVVYAVHWQRSSDSARSLVQDSAPLALQADVDYTLWLSFNKPMRVRNGNGVVTQFSGQNAALAPQIRIEGSSASGGAFSQALTTAATGWRNTAGGAPAGYARYADDAYAVDFRLPASTPVAGARRISLVVDAQDFTGQKLDANPATALDLADGGWQRYEDGNGDATTDAGGADPSLRLIDDGSPLFTAPPGSGGGGAAFGSGSLGPGLLGLLVMALLRRRQHGG